MMINHVWSILCENSVVDKESNNVSIFSVIEELAITKVAELESSEGGRSGIPFNAKIVSLWERVDLDIPAKGTIQIHLIGPSGKSGFKFEREIDLRDFGRLRLVASIVGIPYLGEGRYYFKVRLKVENMKRWKQVASIPLVIKISSEDLVD